MTNEISGTIEYINAGSANYAIAASAYGYCTTLADQPAKTVSMAGFILNEGVTIHVKFQYNNTASNPTLNINNTGAKPIVIYGTTKAGTVDNTTGWHEGAVISFTYDGTNWVQNTSGIDIPTPLQIGAISQQAELLTTNPFAPQSLRGPYISKIDNGFYAADKRWTVTGTNISNISNLFNGNYDNSSNITAGKTSIINIDFDPNHNNSAYFPGYPYGYILVSFYNNQGPSSVNGRVYCNYDNPNHGIGWHEISFSPMADNTTNKIVYRSQHQGYYQISQLEITITAAAATDTKVTQIEIHLDRPHSAYTPFLSKYTPETLYYDLTAPKFIGALQGTADVAKKFNTQRTISLTGKVIGSANSDGANGWEINTGVNINFEDISGTVTIGQGGTGAITVENARANLGTWSLINDTYNTLMPADGTTNDWIKIGTANFDYGLLPSRPGNAGSGHNYLGSNYWYWSAAYIDTVHGNLDGNAATATKLSNTPNNTTTFLRGDNTWSSIITDTLKISTYNNTLTIGALNNSATHIYNSENRPFIFNNEVSTTYGGLGSNTYPWGYLHLGGDIYYKGTNIEQPMIHFIDNTSDQNGNGIIIGGSKSVNTLIPQITANNEKLMWISNDSDIELFPGQGSGFNIAYKTTINSSGITVGVEGNTTKETVFKVSSGAGSIGLYSGSSTTGNRGLWAYPHGTATSGKNIITLDTNNNINYASGTAGNLYMTSGSGVVHSSGAPSFYFLRGDDLAVSNRMGSIFCNYGTTNSITRCDKIYLRHYSYNSSTGAAINDWDQYCLPAATPDLTTSHTYNILTTKDMSFSITGNAATATLAAKATGDSDGNTINTTYAKLSGAAFTGNISITKAGDAYVYSKNSSTGITVYLDSGSGANHGIYSGGYYNGSSHVASGKWLIYRNDAGNVIVNGDCTGNAATATKDSAGNVISSTYLKLSGGTMSGHIYLGGSNASSSTGNTTQIVFGTSSNQHIAVSSNSKALILNPTTSSTTNQIILALDAASTIPYGINTSQQSTMNRTNIGKFIDFCQNGSTCGCLRLQTLGTSTAEGYADLLLGNTTKSNADKNATGRVYLANSNGGWLEIKAMYGSLAGATRNYINVNNWLKASGVTGAVWNDYAEFRKTNKEAKAGQVVIDNDDGSLSITNKRLMPGAQIVSDTFGFSIGETEEAKTPLAVSGRVLVYTYRSREEYHAGMAVCSAPNGTIDIMTREEIQQYPDAIIGIVSEIPEYEEWGTGKVKVNGRIWIKIK